MPKVSTAFEDVTVRGTEHGRHYHQVTGDAGKNQELCKALTEVTLTPQALRGLLFIVSKNHCVKVGPDGLIL